MNQELQPIEVASEKGPERKLNLNRWLGRHEALDLVARSCSSADVKCLKQIREDKLYLEVSPNWDHFCRTELRSSRKKVDTLIHRLDELGPAYFELSKLTYVSPEDFRLLGPVTDDGIQTEGETIAITAENRDKLRAIVSAVRKGRQKDEPAKRSFRTVLESCQTLVELMKRPPKEPSVMERVELTNAMVEVRAAAEGLGVYWLR